MLQAPAKYMQARAGNGYESLTGTGYELPEYSFTPPPELATDQIIHHSAVIVGAGLAGLSLACALNQNGGSASLLDEDNTVGVKGASSRGICYAQKTLEIFKRVGSTTALPPRACSGAWAAPLPGMTRSIHLIWQLQAPTI